jgi:hypothetical protein
VNRDTRAALRACQGLFDRYPGAARPLGAPDDGDEDRTMRIDTTRGPHDLVRHVFGPRRKVFFRLYPAGEQRGVEIAPDVVVAAEVAAMIARATPAR